MDRVVGGEEEEESFIPFRPSVTLIKEFETAWGKLEYFVKSEIPEAQGGKAPV